MDRSATGTAEAAAEYYSYNADCNVGLGAHVGSYPSYYTYIVCKYSFQVFACTTGGTSDVCLLFRLLRCEAACSDLWDKCDHINLLELQAVLLGQILCCWQLHHNGLHQQTEQTRLQLVILVDKICGAGSQNTCF